MTISATGRVYIDKIRSGEERRKKRKLTYSKSDSQLRYPHVRLRHRLDVDGQPDLNIAYMDSARHSRSSRGEPDTLLSFKHNHVQLRMAYCLMFQRTIEVINFIYKHTLFNLIYIKKYNVTSFCLHLQQ